LATYGTQDEEKQTKAQHTAHKTKKNKPKHNIRHTRRRKTNQSTTYGTQDEEKQTKAQHTAHKTKKNKPKHNTICVGHQYPQTNTNNVNKTSSYQQITGGKNEPNILLSQV
jgi:hypothetical protein